MAENKNESPAQKAAKKEADEKAVKEKAAKEKAAKEAAAKEKAAKEKAAKEAAAKGKTESIKEEETQQYPPKFVAAIKKAKYDEKAVMRMKSYDNLGIWRAVFTDGQRHEFSYDGEWLTKPKPKKKEEKKEKE